MKKRGRKPGGPFTARSDRRPWQEHLWKRVDKRADGHWIWTGLIDKEGGTQFHWTDSADGQHYGTTGIRAVMLAMGMSGLGRPVRRMDCGERYCVNPHHFEIPNGERDREIRRRWAMNQKWKTTMEKLANEYGITKQRIEMIVNDQRALPGESETP